VTGHLRRHIGSSAEPLAPGQGGLVEIADATVGGYRDPQGRLHAVKATCTHMGCPLHWNAAETSWDCPCHGSRFRYDGSILNGPAVTPLTRVDVDKE
jgi:Rieske Fe-S protein